MLHYIILIPYCGLRPGEESVRPIFGKGQMGSALMGSLQISCFLTEGLFWYSH